MEVSSFIRFEDDKGVVRYGEPAHEALVGNLIGAAVAVLEGDPFKGLKQTGEQAKVDKVLCPLESTPIMLCIGLNYKEHTKEAKLSIAPYPVIFTKPYTSLTGPYDNVHIHPNASLILDYKGELIVIIRRNAKNISENNALDYVLSYTIGNDISARNF